MDIKEIKQIVDLMKRSDLSEFTVEEESFKLKIKRDTGIDSQPQVVTYAPAPQLNPGQALTPQSAEPSAAQSFASAPEAAEETGIFVTSPMVGTFYASPSPESDAFVALGDTVDPDSIVCIIEAMKIMNEIQAEKNGRVAEVLVENGQPIEFGQRLFRLA